VLTSLKGINNLGDIAGEFLLSNGSARGVVISNAQTHRFVAPGSTGNTLGWGINDSQQVVGWTDLPGKEVGFVLFNNNFTFISAPGRTITQALGINKSGDVVGYYVGTDGVEHGFLRSRWAVCFIHSGSAPADHLGRPLRARMAGLAIKRSMSDIGLVTPVSLL